MGIVRFVHHIQFACKNIWNTYELLSRGFGYHLFCVSNHGPHLNVVLRNGKSVLMLSEVGGRAFKDASNPYVYAITNRLMSRDRPFDIALEVADVNEICDRVKRVDGPNGVLLEPVTHSDYHGKVTMAVVQSCLGGLLHTVIDSSHYTGRFMPGYISPEFGLSPTLKRRLQEKPIVYCKSVPSILGVDHVALACNTNESSATVQWYGDIFVVASLDDDINGFVLKYGDTGMRLKAVDYDPNKSDVSEEEISCKFVIVEPLDKSIAPNQVTRFLKVNNGPGIQHIGLSINDIFDAVRVCRAGGAQFLDPPRAYYDELLKLASTKQTHLDLELLRGSGVLLDTEVLDHNHSRNPHEDAYLLQIFTAPLFDKDGFFMELIERHAGASGFGAGNITALWRAVESARLEPNSTTVKRSAI
ncbi:4-hydroxyphenylpyruvate dioxygenase [Fasciola hepatica]|uniref:4-hydroxyphenylpyruvate dioxygenase n=1 Tax=Fasciola hepatica TaxID=6192 RepID=A0A4E0QY72_FASHE|nr:4-hydroxyphenylpyruvate dioxygenase [Fasciola hepatica]